jgi:predicted GNAT superfamily acetyltransferase
LASDRLFAEWHLESEKVNRLAAGEPYVESREPAAKIVIPNDWNALVKSGAEAALAEQLRVRSEFQTAMANGLIGRGFVRDESAPHYLLY